MAKAEKFYSEWIVKEDEFHPNLKIAAREADKASREAARKHTLSAIAGLKARPNADEPLVKASIELLEGNLRRIEQDIKDAEPITDPEE